MSTNKNWSQIGDDIEGIMRSVMESQDFQKLNETIAKTADQALENVQKGVEIARQRMTNYRTGESAGTARQFEGRRMVKPLKVKERFKGTGGLKAGAMTMAICGYTLLAGFLLATGVVMPLTFVTRSIAAGIAAIVMAPFIVGSGFMAFKGSSMLGQIKRFRRYTEVLKEREFCEIDELAAAVGKTVNFVRKDLLKMIRKHWFREGYLDKQQTTLMVTQNAYQQYMTAQKELESRQRQEMQQQKEIKKQKLSKEAEAVIRTGREYLEEIKRSNDRIPGIEISEKISKLELVISKIFNRVEQHPELVDDLGRFIDYYLPTTVKLLKAYEDLDAQPVQGENITNSKKEIEGTLDTIDKAFEKLLDSFFEEAAWDISSDISVLQNMFAQEGLAENELENIKLKL